jgi:hypothetical protein
MIVEHGGEGVLIRHVGPDGGEVLVSPSPEQEGPAFGDPLCRQASNDRVEVGLSPAAVLEAAAEVLVGPAGCLHHAIERHAVVHNELSHRKNCLPATLGGRSLVDIDRREWSFGPRQGVQSAAERFQPLEI